MSKSRDGTEDFKDVVRDTACSLGYNESKLASVISSFILHKPLEKSPFAKASLKTLRDNLESIAELECFIIKHKKDYVDLHRITEQERDNIEHEVGIFIKACKDQIDILQNMIRNGDAKSWHQLSDDNSNADVIAHKHGVVLILSERLHSVSAQFDRLRSIRFQDAINRAMPRRKVKRAMQSRPLKQPSGLSGSDLWDHGGQEPTSRPLVLQDQILDDETRGLQVELSGLLDAVQETETKMVEMSALNHLMSTHVLQQAQQIEHLYEQAVEATKNVEQGNKELSQAIKRNSGSRTFLLLCLFVLTFSVLFLDWYN